MKRSSMGPRVAGPQIALVSTRLRSALALLALLGGSLWWAVPGASASVAQDVDEDPDIRTESDWTTGNSGMALWFWPERNLAYQLDGTNFDKLKAYDTVTGAPVAEATLDPVAWGNNVIAEYASGNGRHHIAAVDRENGRIFVAYRTGVIPPGAGAQEGPANALSGKETFCPGTNASPDSGCVGGIHVLNAATLETLGKVKIELGTLEGPRVQTILRALHYTPPDPTNGWGGRVLAVVEEVGNGPTENSIVPGLVAPTQNAVPRRNGANIAYAIQLDPDSGRQDWAVRLEGCRNSREARSWMRAFEGHAGTIFRSGGEDRALYVGCHGNASQQGVVVRVPLDADGVPATFPLTVREPAPPDPEAPAAPELPAGAPRQELFVGPDAVTVMLSDPASGRILMRVDDAGEVWWVFDTAARQFLGTIGIGAYRHGHTTYGLDEETGRLYVVAAKAVETGAPGGLYMADVRRNPLPQALVRPEFADPPRTARGLNTGGGASDVGRALSVLPRSADSPTRLYVTKNRDDGEVFRVIVDASPVSVDAPLGLGEVVRTLDIPEAAGVTDATFDGTARGFGFRTILIGGVEGAARMGPADPIGVARGVPHFDSDTTVFYSGQSVDLGEQGGAVARQVPLTDPCTDAQRELVVAFVGPRSPAVVDASSARGEAQPLLVDVRTRQDVEHPMRCAPKDWQTLWQTGLFGRAPVEEPSLDWPFEEGSAECTATDTEQNDAWSDPVMGSFASQVSCSQDEVSGWGQARGIDLEGVSVAGALSSFRVYRDVERGMVARVESIARGVNLGGVVRIDTVRGVAESWANGRAAEDAETGEGQEGNPFNCDVTRPAGTCFQRHVFGVRALGPDGRTAFQCGPCGPEQDLLDAMNRAMSGYGFARFREPDPELARGSSDGYIAAVTKKSQERFADIVMNSDLLETMVPMLEVVRFTPHNRPDSQNTPDYSFGTPPRGRQVLQFAAVEVSSTYGIQCLLHYDAATNHCGAPLQEPGSLTVSLADVAGTPLAGGRFELRADVDADGVLGLADTLVPDGTCVTGEDGVGDCAFVGLPAGGYLVQQVAAPPGHAAAADAVAVALGAGEARTVAFVNTSNLSQVLVVARAEDGTPLSGAGFAVYPDPDADGQPADGAQPAATCTTDASGSCAMTVPAGAYVLTQTAAPAGLEPIAPVPFTFASGGQTAAVTVVNWPAAAVPAPGPAPAPVVEYTAPPVSPAVQTVGSPPDLRPPPAGEDTPPTAVLGDTIVRIVRAPGDALRLLSRSPLQSLAWTASVLLLGAAGATVRRRRLLLGLAHEPVTEP